MSLFESPLGPDMLALEHIVSVSRITVAVGEDFKPRGSRFDVVLSGGQTALFFHSDKAEVEKERERLIAEHRAHFGADKPPESSPQEDDAFKGRLASTLAQATVDIGNVIVGEISVVFEGVSAPAKMGDLISGISAALSTTQDRVEKIMRDVVAELGRPTDG